MMLLALAFAAAGVLWIDMGKASLAAQRAQTLADVSVLSSLRITSEAMETVADRWEEFGRFYDAATGSGIVLNSAHWTVVRKSAGDLRRALSGYQGRTTAVIKVVAEANGVARESVEVLDAVGAQLGLTAEKALIRDEMGRTMLLDGAWYSRSWTLDALDGKRNDRARHRAHVSVRTARGERWEVAREARGRLTWDVDIDDPSGRARGNGGYPRNWDEALEGARLTPNRWAYFRATLRHE